MRGWRGLITLQKNFRMQFKNNITYQNYSVLFLHAEKDLLQNLAVEAHCWTGRAAR